MPAAVSDPEYAERIRCAATLLGFTESEAKSAIRSMTGNDRAALAEVVDWIREYEVSDILYEGAKDAKF